MRAITQRSVLDEETCSFVLDRDKELSDRLEVAEGTFPVNLDVSALDARDYRSRLAWFTSCVLNEHVRLRAPSVNVLCHDRELVVAASSQTTNRQHIGISRVNDCHSLFVLPLVNKATLVPPDLVVEYR